RPCRRTDGGPARHPELGEDALRRLENRPCPVRARDDDPVDDVEEAGGPVDGGATGYEIDLDGRNRDGLDVGRLQGSEERVGLVPRPRDEPPRAALRSAAPTRRPVQDPEVGGQTATQVGRLVDAAGAGEEGRPRVVPGVPTAELEPLAGDDAERADRGPAAAT